MSVCALFAKASYIYINSVLGLFFKFIFLSLLFLFVQLPLYSLPSLGCRHTRWDVFSQSEARE